MDKRSITEFCDTDYLNYAHYVVEQRAIPSVIDGFKPTQRKVIFVANRIWRNINDKPLKVFQLAGKVSAESYYHHGDASLNNAITSMAQDFKNSMPLLAGIGQFGSLRSPEPGAPRYISTKLTDSFRLLYKDFELLNPKYEEGVEIEPDFFLPIIPTVLLNGTSGIAVGFATNILNRHPLDLIDGCISYLKGKEVPELKPWIRGFRGTFTKDPEMPNKWIISGKFDIVNTSTVQVTDIPPYLTFEDYEKHLEKKMEKKDISSYEDMGRESINYLIKFKRSDLEAFIKANNLKTVLKLETTETENLTTLDEHGKLKIFKSAKEILKYFVDFRLVYFQKRKDYIIEKLKADILLLENKTRFIKGIIEKTILVNNVPKAEIEKQLIDQKFDKINDSYDYLLRMPIHSLTKENYEEFLKSLQEKKNELVEIEKRQPLEMYLEDLATLRKVIEKEFK